MNNKDNYKNAIDQIHASEKLKEKAFEKSKYANSNKYTYLKILSSCAVFLIVFFIGNMYLDNQNKTTPIDKNPNEIIGKTEIATTNIELPKFESMKQLKEAVQIEKQYFWNNLEIEESQIALDSVTKGESVATESATTTTNSDLRGELAEQEKLTDDFSNTNVQVENVDEADIVKTDGEYIYYVSYYNVYIVKADTLEVVAKIENINEDNENFTVSEIFLNEDKVVLLGRCDTYEEQTTKTKEMSSVTRINNCTMTKIIVYDISDKSNPVITREASLEGTYVDSRMIGDNLYFISRKSAYFYNDIDDEEILPLVCDTVMKEEAKRINYDEIYYFPETKSYCFMLVAGLNINNSEEINVETFFGAGDIVYCSDKYLYLTNEEYDSDNIKTTIYKFNINNSEITLKAKGEVEGSLNNQFSMDEYEGNLRVATTGYTNLPPEKVEVTRNGDSVSTSAYTGPKVTSNNLYILNENMELIGQIEDLALEERIYSVRFIGKVGYMVTFKQIDPLFVIDLSDPTNPEIKGELKIPGYSSYLHPYDETHIIGIGYNTKSNGFGGVTNDNMKMSMFDVSDLENPVEIFNVDIGEGYTSSEVTYNHKALFYKKSENLIGFPVSYDYRENGFIIFEIDLENNEFKKYGEIINKSNYRTNIDRVIYIRDILYTLAESKIVSYDLNTLEKLNEVDLDDDYETKRYNGIEELMVLE